MYDTRARKNILIVYTFFLGTTLALWLISKQNIGIITRFPYISVTQISGLFAVTLVCLNLLLSSRLKYFENLFGGLDKLYRQHQMTGKLAFSFMLAHPLFLLLSTSDFALALKIYVLSLSNVAYNYGKLALLGFSILIVLTIFIKLPYHIWRRTHQLMIIPVSFAALHVANIPSDVAAFPLLRYWVLGLLGIGIVTYFYKVVLYSFIGPKYKYEIRKVNLRGPIVEVILYPLLTRQLNFEPGQFVFVVFGSKNVKSEEHPFSISSPPGEKEIRLSIKKSGDFTSTLSNLKKSSLVNLYGPYGRFGQKALSTNKDLVLIAGGIGITPFLSLTKYIKNNNIDKHYNLIYSYKNEQESVYKEELKEIGGEKVTTHNSDKNGHLTAEIISKRVNLEDKLIMLCGPKAMMVALTKQFVEMGIKRRNIIFEDFDLKG